MLRKFTILMLVGVVALAALPPHATAQRSEIIVVPVWIDGHMYTIDQSVIPPDVGVLHYFWFASTEALVTNFIQHAHINVTVDGYPLFSEQNKARAYWGVIEPYEFQGHSAYRASWYFQLPLLSEGQHKLRTIISIDEEISDGFYDPFQPGVLHYTNITLNAVGAVSPTPIAVVPDVEVDADVDATTPVPPAPTAASAFQVDLSEVRDEPVVGTFIDWSEAYWAPRTEALLNEQITFAPSQTLWVFGMDETHSYYKVLLDAAYLWVRAETIGPTPGEPWNSKALPNVVVPEYPYLLGQG